MTALVPSPPPVASKDATSEATGGEANSVNQRTGPDAEDSGFSTANAKSVVRMK